MKLTIREEDGNPVLVRKYPKLGRDSTSLLMGISQPTTEIFAKVYDTVKFHPPPVADCEGYGNYHFQQRAQQERPPDSTQLVEQQVYNLLTTHLNRNLPKLEDKKVSNRPPSATALLKIREVPGFPAEKVIIVDNSSPHNTEVLAKALSTFLEKNMRLFKEPSLQDYLLVVMVVMEDVICVLPPQVYPHWGF